MSKGDPCDSGHIFVAPDSDSPIRATLSNFGGLRESSWRRLGDVHGRSMRPLPYFCGLSIQPPIQPQTQPLQSVLHLSHFRYLSESSSRRLIDVPERSGRPVSHVASTSNPGFNPKLDHPNPCDTCRIFLSLATPDGSGLSTSRSDLCDPCRIVVA